jgi:type IV pilus assembly protein PilM
MAFWNQIARLMHEPPLEHVFELSEAGIAYACQGVTGFQEFESGVLKASPLADNILRADAVASAIARIVPPNGAKRRPAAVILPDYAARVSLLDFDSFPSSPEEQLALVRFRVKKTVPFDIESAAVSYWAQPVSVKSGGKKIEVVAVTVALEVLARYEAVFRIANLHPGQITTSSLAALNLYRDSGVAVIAKMSGNVLTVAAVADGRLRLFRCLSLEQEAVEDGAIEKSNDEEIREVLYPTFAYIEDELGQKPEKLLLCGFPRLPEGLKIETEPLRSRTGAPTAYNAGLLGYLEAAG